MSTSPLGTLGTRALGRAPFDRELRAAEAAVLGQLALVREQLRRAVNRATGLSGRVTALDVLIRCAGERHREARDALVELMAHGQLGRSELQLVSTLVSVNDLAGRMVTRCADIATLSDLTSEAAPSASQLACLREMTEVADGGIEAAGVALRERDPSAEGRIRATDERLRTLNRACLAMVGADGAEPDEREAVFLVTFIARVIERIGGDAVEIARRVRLLTETG